MKIRNLNYFKRVIKDQKYKMLKLYIGGKIEERTELRRARLITLTQTTRE